MAFAQEQGKLCGALQEMIDGAPGDLKMKIGLSPKGQQDLTLHSKWA